MNGTTPCKETIVNFGNKSKYKRAAVMKTNVVFYAYFGNRGRH